MAADEIKKCSVRIGGVYYQLVTAENEQYTRKIAARADEMINRIAQDNPQLSQTMATVLALVNAVDELTRAWQQLKGMEGQHLDLDNKASEARRELSRLREQHWEMKKELLRVTELNRDYQTLINKLTQAAAQKPETAATEQLTSQLDTLTPTEEAETEEDQTVPVEEEQPVPPVDDQPAPADEQSDQDENGADAEKVPEQEPLAGLPADLPDPNRRTIDRLKQTNLDDYLHAFGLNGQSRDNAQTSR